MAVVELFIGEMLTVDKTALIYKLMRLKGY